MTDICAAADIAPRTFHRYFSSKEDVVAEPIRRMAKVVADHIASAPATAGDGEVIAGAMLAIGGFAVANRDWLAALRIVVGQSQHLRTHHLALQPDQEREIAGMLAARRADPVDADWRLRLLVGCAVAGFRVWFDDYFRDHLDDPLGRLGEVLHTATPHGFR